MIDLANMDYMPIWNYKYAQWFQEVKYNGKTLSGEERREFVSVIDETIAQYSEGLPLMYETLEENKDKRDDYHEIERTLSSIWLFALITMIDSMVASKYFILADMDYDRRFMRGKLLVILNEGFKKLYGFKRKNEKKTEWERLSSIMKFFPPEINRQYCELTNHLDKLSKSSSWWKDERDFETHIDAERLYKSRLEEVIESKVMMDTMKLFQALLAVNSFLANAHTCLFNFLVTKYRNGELKEV